MPPSARLAVVLTTCVLVFASGCGGEPGPAAQPSPSPTAQDKRVHNQQDIAFVTEMLERHQQAIDMASIADERNASAEVAALALEIEENHRIELLGMEGWLVDWGAEAPPADHDADTRRAGGAS